MIGCDINTDKRSHFFTRVTRVYPAFESLPNVQECRVYFLIKIIKLRHGSANLSIKVLPCAQRHWMGPTKITLIVYGFIKCFFILSFMIVIYVIFRRGAYIDVIHTTYSSYSIITLSVCIYIYIYIYIYTYTRVYMKIGALCYVSILYVFIVLVYYLVSNDQIKTFNQRYWWFHCLMWLVTHTVAPLPMSQPIWFQGTLSLTWINFNPSIDN